MASWGSLFSPAVVSGPALQAEEKPDAKNEDDPRTQKKTLTETQKKMLAKMKR